MKIKLALLFLSAVMVMTAAPLTHSVYFKLKYAEDSAEFADFHRRAMELARIPSVMNFEWLEEFSPKNDFTHGLTMQFADQAAYTAYNVHPLHVRFVNEVWIPNVADFMEIDTVPGEMDQWTNLLDADLSRWEVWTGKLDPSVHDKAAGLLRDQGWAPEKPVGLGDPFSIYSVTRDTAGELILNISGEVYAGLTSLDAYENYHLTMEFKWGETKYAPRLDKQRDSGILYHCYGPHGRFKGIWKSSLELQVQERDIGDLIQLVGPTSVTTRKGRNLWDPTGPKSRYKGRVIRSLDMEKSHGEWNRIDLYVIGDSAIHVVNGTVVMALTKAKKNKNEPLTSGQIQIQSEGAECYYRDIRIRPITTYPASIQAAAGI